MWFWHQKGSERIEMSVDSLELLDFVCGVKDKIGCPVRAVV